MKNKIRKSISISVIVLIMFSFISIAATVQTYAADMSYTVGERNVDIDIDKISAVFMEGAGVINHNCYSGVGKCAGKGRKFYFRVNSEASLTGVGAKTTVGSYYIYIDK